MINAFNRELMEELIFFQSTLFARHASSTAKANGRWWRLYNRHDVDSCISKIRTVSFCQTVELYSSLKITAISSGFSIGSANWIIQTDFEKISYMSDSSVCDGYHPENINKEDLKRSDLLILTRLSSSEMQSTADAAITSFLQQIGTTLSGGGNVLVPTQSCGIVLDLIERIHLFLNSIGHNHTPIYFISPVAEYIIAYANVSGEWLSRTRQERLYQPEPPFQHEELLRSGRLHLFIDVDDRRLVSIFREPCIVLAGHCSLRFGPVTHFLRLWANDAKNSLLLIDPFFEKASILASATALISPTRLSMRVIHCPIDTRLSAASAKALLNELQPNHLIIPKQYSSSIMTTPLGDSLKTSSAFQPLEILSLPLKRPFEKATLSRELALYLRPKELNDKVSFVNINAILDVTNNRLTLNRSDQLLPQKRPFKAIVTDQSKRNMEDSI